MMLWEGGGGVGGRRKDDFISLCHSRILGVVTSLPHPGGGPPWPSDVGPWAVPGWIQDHVCVPAQDTAE